MNKTLASMIISTGLVSSTLIFTLHPSSIIEHKDTDLLAAQISTTTSYLDYLNKLKDEITLKFNDSQINGKKVASQIEQLTKQLDELNKMANMFSKMLESISQDLTKEMQSKLNK
jgi:hypothetical protein